jgi:hypothetical protein
MLDSAATTSDPPPPRSNEPDRAGRADAADDSKATAAPAADTTKSTADAKSGKTGSDPAGTQGAAAAPDDEPAKQIELKLVAATLDPAITEAAKADAAKAADADGKTKQDADSAAPLDAMLGDALAAAPGSTPAALAETVTQPIAATIALAVAPAPFATPSTDPMEADALAALQTAAQQSGAAKPGSVQGDAKDAPQAKGTASAEPQAKGGTAAETPIQSAAADLEAESTADPQPAWVRASNKEGQPHEDTATEPAATRHLAADAPAKPESLAPSQGLADAASAMKASTAAVASLGATGQSNQPYGAAPAPAANAAAQAQAAAVPLAGLAIEIATQSHAGKNHFEIRLDPPELGRIDVRLHVDRDGNVSTRMIAERSDTLDLLKRDAQGLERALQQAGLKTSDNALQFSLRQQQTFTRDDTPMQTTAHLVVPDDDPAPLEALRQGYGRLLGLGGGLDIRV